MILKDWLRTRGDPSVEYRYSPLKRLDLCRCFRVLPEGDWCLIGDSWLSMLD